MEVEGIKSCESFGKPSVIGYKVVEVVDGKRVSANCRSPMFNNFISQYEVEYQEGVKAVPVLQGSKLFAFPSQSLAERWLLVKTRAKPDYTGNESADHFTDMEIWEAELENPQPAKLCSCDIANFAIKAFWNPLGHPPEIIDCDGYSVIAGDYAVKSVSKVPTGTVVCDSITPLRLVSSQPHVPRSCKGGENDLEPA
jgi:hypothetical protein